MTDRFSRGTDWEQSSGPILSRKVHEDDLWPHGGGKDDLADGLHPMLAIGQIANRVENIVGVMISYEPRTGIAEMNLAPGFVSRHWVTNVLTYNGNAPNTWAANIDVGDVVYLDDSASIGAGVTLSLSPLNQAGDDNLRAGIVWRCQDEYPDEAIGGANADPFPKAFTANNATHYLRLCILLWPVVA